MRRAYHSVASAALADESSIATTSNVRRTATMAAVKQLDAFAGPDGHDWRIVLRVQEERDHPELVHPLVVELLQSDGRARKARNLESEGAAVAWADVMRRAVEAGSVRAK